MRYREHLKILEDLHIDVLKVRTSGKHCVARCRAPQGKVFSATFSKSPSDHRSILNFRADVRRACGAQQ